MISTDTATNDYSMRDTPNYSEGPLSGITVLDCTIWQAGPFATVILSDLGAKVIKVEDPTLGDPGRGLRDKGGLGNISTYFEAMNRNKRSITINLQTRKGQAVFHRLAKKVDVVVQNFRVGVAEKLKVDYETLKAINPRLIHASANGLGSRGPDAKVGVFDLMGLARSGAMRALQYPDCDLEYLGSFGLADQTTAIVLAQSILAALLARERFGIGQAVEISQLGAMLMLQQMGVTRYLINGFENKGYTRKRPMNPLFSIYTCSGGDWIALGGIQPDRYWADFCDVIGLPQLTADPRFTNMEVRSQHAAALVPLLDKAFAQESRTYWIDRLTAIGMPNAPVNSYEDLISDPQVISNSYIEEVDHPTHGKLRQIGTTIRFSETPARVRTTAPEFGQHTEEVLLEAGFEWDEVVQLKQEGVV